LTSDVIYKTAKIKAVEDEEKTGKKPKMSSLYPEMRFSWEIRSVDALFCNGMTRVGDLSREAILSSIRDEQVM
jgi:hypothetical protein